MSSYSCLSSSNSIPEPPAGFLEAIEFPDRLQGTPEQPAFAQGGSGYNLIVNRPVSIEWRYQDSITGAIKISPWTYLRVEFAPDLDLIDTIVASHDFSVADPGTPQERFTGTMPASELNLLTVGQWYMARLVTSEGDALSHCPFYVLGGVK